MSDVSPQDLDLNCDSDCGGKATHWFGNTSAAICDKYKCLNKQNERYEEHCRECEAEWEHERLMMEEYGQ